MQQVKINEVPYNIPISWGEATYKQGVGVLKYLDNKGQQLSELSGIPIEIIDKLQDNQVSTMFALISFTENLHVFEMVNVLDKYKDFDFGSTDFGTAEKCRKIMNSDGIGQELVIDIIKLLTGDDISDMPFLEVIGTANFFLTNTLISMIVSPSLEKVKLAMSKSKRVLADFKSLEALQLMLKSQGQEPWGIQ